MLAPPASVSFDPSSACPPQMNRRYVGGARAGSDCEQVVAPDVAVDGQQVVAAAAGLAVEYLGLHGKAGEIAGERVRRAAHQAEAEVRDLAVGAVAAPQVLLRARLQVVHATALAVLLERHDVA